MKKMVQNLRRSLILPLNLAALIIPTLLAAAVLNRFTSPSLGQWPRDILAVCLGSAIGFGFSFLFAANWSKDASGGKLLAAAAVQFHGMAGTLYPKQVIQNGEIVQPRNPGDARLLGPRQIELHQSAVILYKGAEQTGVEGGTTYLSKPREYVKKAYGLKVHQRLVYIEPVLTFDGLPVRVKVLVGTSIRVRPEVVQGKSSLNDEEKRRIARLYLEVPNTEELINTVLERVIRREAGKLSFERLTRSSTLDRLEPELLSRINGELTPRGLCMHMLEVSSAQPADSVLDATTNAMADGERDVVRAAAWRDAYRILAEAGTTAQQAVEERWAGDPGFVKAFPGVVKRFPELKDTRVTEHLSEALEKKGGDKTGGDAQMPPNAEGEPGASGDTTGHDKTGPAGGTSQANQNPDDSQRPG